MTNILDTPLERLWQALPEDERTRLNLQLSLIGPPSPLGTGEIGAITFASPKTAALIFDKVWGGKGIPDTIRFGCVMPWEGYLLARLALMLYFDKRARHTGPLIEASKTASSWRRVRPVRGLPKELRSDATLYARISNEVFAVLPAPKAMPVAALVANIENLTVSAIAQWFDLDPNWMTVPIFRSQEGRDQTYETGSYDVIVTALTNIPVVTEEALEWDQVLELRRDPDSSRKLRRFTHWLDGNMIGKSAQFISEEISIRLEDYKWALRKHGIETTVGVISSTLEPKFLLSAGGLIAGTAIVGNPDLASFVGLAVTVGKIGAEITKAALNLLDSKKTLCPEIAFVYEIQRRLIDRKEVSLPREPLLSP